MSKTTKPAASKSDKAATTTATVKAPPKAAPTKPKGKADAPPLVLVTPMPAAVKEALGAPIITHADLVALAASDDVSAAVRKWLPSVVRSSAFCFADSPLSPTDVRDMYGCTSFAAGELAAALYGLTCAAGLERKAGLWSDGGHLVAWPKDGAAGAKVCQWLAAECRTAVKAHDAEAGKAGKDGKKADDLVSDPKFAARVLATLGECLAVEIGAAVPVGTAVVAEGMYALVAATPTGGRVLVPAVTRRIARTMSARPAGPLTLHYTTCTGVLAWCDADGCRCLVWCEDATRDEVDALPADAAGKRRKK